MLCLGSSTLEFIVRAFMGLKTYGLGFKVYDLLGCGGLRLLGYELRIKGYELRVKGYGLRVKG